MPEASVYEDRESKPHDNYVRPTRQIPTMQPKTHTSSVQFAAESALRPSVLATKASHERTDLRGRGRWFGHTTHCCHRSV